MVSHSVLAALALTGLTLFPALAEAQAPSRQDAVVVTRHPHDANAFTQGLFGLTRGGDIEDSEHAIAVGKRYTGKIERSPIGQFDAPIALLAIQRCGANYLIDARNSRWVGKIFGDRIQQVFGLRMTIQSFRIDTPGAGESAVP